MELLGAIAEKLSCDYLSDLRYRTIHPDQARELLLLSEEQFTLEDYTKAAFYISGVYHSYPSSSQAKSAIIAHLLERER